MRVPALLRLDRPSLRRPRPRPRSGRTVLVWRSQWLPPSETFVRDHVDSLQSWTGVALGAVRVPSSLVRPADHWLFGPGRLDSLRSRAFRWLPVSARLYRFVRDCRPALVHAHFGTDAVRVAPVCWALRVPLVVTLHGKDVTSQVVLGGLRGAQYRWLLRRTMRLAAVVIAVSQPIADRAVALGADPAKVRVHHSGIPLRAVAEGVQPGPGWDVLLVGRLTEKKGAHDLLQALDLVREDHPRLRAALIGSGPLEAQVREEVRRLGLDVHLLGTLTPVQVAAAIAAAKVVAVPSRTASTGDSEGLPTVLLEAAAQCRAVAAYRHSGIPEAVVDGETGLLSAEGDHVGLARSLSRLLADDALRERLGRAGRARVERDFDIRRQTRRLEALYDEVTGAAPEAA